MSDNMTEIPEEIRAAALKLGPEFIDAHPIRDGAITSHEHLLQATKNTRVTAFVDGFEACYQFLTSGKPDGWIAKNLDGRLYYLSFGIDKAACESNLLYWKNSDEHSDEEKLAEYKAEGWQITPVRLLKCGAADE